MVTPFTPSSLNNLLTDAAVMLLQMNISLPQYQDHTTISLHTKLPVRHVGKNKTKISQCDRLKKFAKNMKPGYYGTRH